MNRLDDLEEDTAALRDLIEKKPDEVARMREEGTFTAEYLEDMFGISQDSVYALRDLAKEVYDCGNYVEAAVYLQHFIELAEKDMSYGELMSAMWGQLAAEILSKNFEVAVKSTSGGGYCVGGHALHGWPGNQELRALSTGVAEFYAILKGSPENTGRQSVLEDFGFEDEDKRLDLRRLLAEAEDQVTCSQSRVRGR